MSLFGNTNSIYNNPINPSNSLLQVNNTSTLFSSNNTTNTPSLFGYNQNKQSTNLFGNNTNASNSSLFSNNLNNTNNKSLWSNSNNANNTTSSLWGQPFNNTTSLFGGNKPSLFENTSTPNNTNSFFANNSNNSLNNANSSNNTSTGLWNQPSNNNILSSSNFLKPNTSLPVNNNPSGGFFSNINNNTGFINNNNTFKPNTPNSFSFNNPSNNTGSTLFNPNTTNNNTTTSTLFSNSFVKPSQTTTNIGTMIPNKKFIPQKPRNNNLNQSSNSKCLVFCVTNANQYNGICKDQIRINDYINRKNNNGNFVGVNTIQPISFLNNNNMNIKPLTNQISNTFRNTNNNISSSLFPSISPSNNSLFQNTTSNNNNSSFFNPTTNTQPQSILNPIVNNINSVQPLLDNNQGNMMSNNNNNSTMGFYNQQYFPFFYNSPGSTIIQIPSLMDSFQQSKGYINWQEYESKYKDNYKKYQKSFNFGNIKDLKQKNKKENNQINLLKCSKRQKMKQRIINEISQNKSIYFDNEKIIRKKHKLIFEDQNSKNTCLIEYDPSKNPYEVFQQFIQQNQKIGNYFLNFILLDQENNKVVQKDQMNYQILKVIRSQQMPSQQELPLIPPDYNTIPSRSILAKMSKAQLKNGNTLQPVQNFIIQNEHGKIQFLEPVNLLGVNLQKIISIKNSDITIYSEDTPDKGQRLNKQCYLTFYNMGKIKQKYKKFSNEKYNKFLKKLWKWAHNRNMKIMTKTFNPENGIFEAIVTDLKNL